MIRKKLSLFMATILLTGAGFTQDDLRERPTFTVKGGINYANIWDTDGENFIAGPKSGIAAGISLAVPIGKILAIQPEVYFSQKGFTAKGKFLTIPYEFTRTSNYIDIPLLASFRPVPFLNIVAGPQASFQLSQEDKFTIGSFSSEEKQKFENDNWRKHMLGLHAGMDINVNHFVISPRVSMDFQDNKGDGTATDPRYKNIVLQLTVGYKF